MVIFAVNDYCKQNLRKHYPLMSESKMSLFTGAFAGFCSLSVLVPLDLLKCRAQMTTEGKLDIPREARTVF